MMECISRKERKVKCNAKKRKESLTLLCDFLCAISLRPLLKTSYGAGQIQLRLCVTFCFDRGISEGGSNPSSTDGSFEYHFTLTPC
jgi:hypothetical protein